MNRQLMAAILLIVALGAGAYYWYGSPSAEPEAATANVALIEFQQRVGELRRLTNIELNTAILQDPFFRSSRPVTATATAPVTPGRPNPFQPF